MQRILAIIRKEFIHISRDFRTLMIVIVLPVVMLFLFGFAINLDLKDIRLVTIDYSGTPQSRELIRDFQGSGFFITMPYDGPLSELETFFYERTARAALIIPKDFSATLVTEPRTKVQIIVDASDPNSALAIRKYVTAVFSRYNASNGAFPVIELEPTVWYNPAMKSSNFFVPGLAALILIMISALLTSIAIVREKETGTMEQILVSPLQPHEIVIGKVIPYICLAFVDLMIIFLIARFVFDVPFVGNLASLVFASVLFILVGLSLGLLISTKAKSQQVAMMMALIATLLPTVFLSGFMFPLPSMPQILQLISHIVPARYYLVLIRGIMLKGNSLSQLFPLVAILTVFASALLLVSSKKFKTNLEG